MRTFKFRQSFLFLIILVQAYGLFAQSVPSNPPLPVELVFGHERVMFQSIINRNFGESSFGFFNIVNGIVGYDEFTTDTEIVITSFGTKEIVGPLRATAGVQLHSIKGFVPLTGVQFFKASKKWLIVLSPSVLYRPDINIESVVILE